MRWPTPASPAIPSVIGEPHIRFYAGVPLRTRDGHNIGTLCAIDFKPRDFGQKQVEILTDLARVAMAEFEMRQLVRIDAADRPLLHPRGSARRPRARWRWPAAMNSR